MVTLDRARLLQLLADEDEMFVERHCRSGQLFEQAKEHLLDGVPMNWMTRWASPFPLFVREAHGQRLTCADGHEYIDLCLGDTGAMTGHSPAATVEALRIQLDKGITTMLPSEDASWVGGELARRFGLRFWQDAMTATDANRFALRIARQITRRPKVLVFNWCYHGSASETLVTLREDGSRGPRPGNVGPAVDPSLTTKVVEFNDLASLEEQLAPGDVACVLAEPALTNIGIVLPEPGFTEALRRITRETGTLLVVDETHTICAGPGGCTLAWGLEPDILTLGKAVGGGLPCAVYGFGQTVADALRSTLDYHAADVSGLGTTLAGNPLQMAAIRATLAQVLTQENYTRMIALCERFCGGVQTVIDEFELPWIVQRLGCRGEYWPVRVPPRNGGEASAAEDPELDRYMHLFQLNRGIAMTPFHNMALIGPEASEADVDKHTEIFREAVGRLFR
jgi:glutamate-1-semialdehyde 2,1-aminomutase